ncbi:MAG: RCC1 domain-containing protein [Sandaracinaceae bacterium]
MLRQGARVGRTARESEGCVQTSTGWLGCFGQGSQGGVGDGETEERGIPVDIGILDAVVVASGDQHQCALRAGGTVWCWGDASDRQQGLPSTTDQPNPQQLAGFVGVTDLDAGGDFNCMIDSGVVLCWGDNDSLQLGRGGTSTTDSEVSMPVSMPGALAVDALALGFDHGCALLSDRTVACWGDDDNGQLGNGGSNADSSTPTLVPGLTGIVKVESGFDSSCALDSTGQVFCWGDNGDGQLGNGAAPTDATSPVLVTLPGPAADIALGYDTACARVGTGVMCWGESNVYQMATGDLFDVTTPRAITGLSGTIVALEGGRNGLCALNMAGERFCWGDSEEGQLGIAPIYQLELVPLTFSATPSVIRASVPDYRGQICGLLPGGAVECAGAANTVSAATTTGAVGVFPGVTAHLLTPTDIPAFNGILDGQLGSAFACARTATAVLCLGDNARFQLGQGGTSVVDSPTPLPVVGLGAVDEIEAGGQFACARVGGTVQCWGDNDGLQSGGASASVNVSMPTAIAGLSDAVDVDLGGNFGCALRTGGLVSCWGDNASGQLGQGAAGTDSAMALAVMGLPSAATKLVVGEDQACVLIGSEVWCWGDANYGELAQGNNTDSPIPLLAYTGATDVFAGNNYFCAIRTDTGVTCWGYGLDGHLGNGGRDVTGLDEFTTPVDWPGLTGVLELVTSNNTTAVRDASGWRILGFRGFGQLGDGTTLQATVPTRPMTY